MTMPGTTAGTAGTGAAKRRCSPKIRKRLSRFPETGTFEPQIVPQGRKRVPLFKDQMLSRYSFGMRNWDIKSRLEQAYHVAASPELISWVTDAVMEDVWE
jgi:transposase-like protein